MANSKAAGKIRDRIRELRRVPAGELRANPRNWRKHPDAQQKALRGALAEIGFADAVLARELEGGELELIDGHLRTDESEADQLVPTLVLDLSEAEADKLLATLDPLAAMATADADMLGDLLATVETQDDALAAMLDDLAEGSGVDLAGEPPEAPEAQTDRAEELQQQWGTAPKQLWQIAGKAGTHRLLCGDSTVAADVERVLGGQVPPLMVTDPPYGVNYDPAWRNEAAEKGQLAYAVRRVGEVTNDDRVDWSDAWRLFPGDVAYTWSPAGDNVIHTGAALQAVGYQIRNQIIWRKPHFPISRGHYTYQHEPCWYAVKKGRKSHWIGDKNASSVWDIPLDQNVEGGHSTQKPLECMARPIRNHEGEVYEPFLGSGTTMVAAEQLGRVCYAVEISPSYVAVALQRMTDMGCECKLTEEANGSG